MDNEKTIETDDLSIHLKIMNEILSKKKDALTQILNITENMEYLFYQPASREKADFLSEMTKEKQQLIDFVINSDNAFQNLFAKIQPLFEENAHLHKDTVLEIQNFIRDVMEIDVKIRAQEEKNKGLLNLAANSTSNEMPLRKQNKINNEISKKHVLDQYEKSKNFR